MINAERVNDLFEMFSDCPADENIHICQKAINEVSELINPEIKPRPANIELLSTMAAAWAYCDYVISLNESESDDISDAKEIKKYFTNQAKHLLITSTHSQIKKEG